MASKPRPLADLIVDAVRNGAQLKVIARKSGKAHLAYRKRMNRDLQREFRDRLGELVESLGWDYEVGQRCRLCGRLEQKGWLIVGCGVCGHSTLIDPPRPKNSHATYDTEKQIWRTF